MPRETWPRPPSDEHVRAHVCTSPDTYHARIGRKPPQRTANVAPHILATRGRLRAAPAGRAGRRSPHYSMPRSMLPQKPSSPKAHAIDTLGKATALASLSSSSRTRLLWKSGEARVGSLLDASVSRCS
eukprot:2181336-Prymnesium_polylepis.1